MVDRDGIGPESLNLSYFGDCFTDAGEVAASTLEWRPSSWWKFGLFGLAVGRLSNREGAIQTWVQANRNPTSDRIANLATRLGDGKYVLPALGALYGYGSLAHSDRARRAALLSAEAVAVSGLFTDGIKLLAGKHRPDDGGTDHGVWDGPSLFSGELSFPSGHSAAAFSVATVMAAEYGDHRYVPPLAYGLATLCALSRINNNAHWASDVVVGSAIGYLTGNALVSIHEGKRNMNLTFQPVVGGGRAGLSMALRF